MSEHPPIRVTDLAQNSDNPFDIRPDPAAQRALAAQLGLTGLRKLRFSGTIRARGKRDWQIKATLGATVTQACVVTLAPVTTRIDRDVRRTLLANWSDPDEEEVEMTGDDTIDPLGSHIDLNAIMSEALALALPLYPRAPDADLGEAVFTKPGEIPMTREAAKPFAGLADLTGLRDTLKGDD